MDKPINVVQAYGPVSNQREIIALMNNPMLLQTHSDIFKLVPKENEPEKATLSILYKRGKRYFRKKYEVLVNDGILLI